MGALQQRYDCLGLSLFHKIHLGITRPLVKTFMPEIQVKSHNTRVLFYYCNFPYINKQFSYSFYPHFTKKWNSSPKSLQQERDINEFKLKIKNLIKPPKYNFFFKGSTKRGCSLLTQLRVGRSILNDHAFLLGLSLSPQCLCHAPRESPGQILLKCFLFYKERLTLKSKVETLLTKFYTFTEKKTT